MNKVKEFLFDFLFDIAGVTLFSFGLQSFSAANQIAPGGISGISIIVNFLTNIPIGTTSLLINIPLLIVGTKFLGKVFILKTLKTVVLMTFVLDFIFPFVPEYKGEPLLAAIFGGVLMGAGLGIVFLRDSTTGGSDIIIRLVQLKFPFLQLGRLMFAFDILVLGISGIVFGNIETILYGMISIFACSKMVDSMLYGMDVGKMVMIISNKNDEIVSGIISNLNRSATILKAQGAYTKEEKNVVMVAVRKSQFHKLKKLVQTIDKYAFIIVTEAGEIIGEGFKSIEK